MSYGVLVFGGISNSDDDNVSDMLVKSDGLASVNSPGDDARETGLDLSISSTEVSTDTAIRGPKLKSFRNTDNDTFSTSESKSFPSSLLLSLLFSC
jgi:hypothetical protein